MPTKSAQEPIFVQKALCDEGGLRYCPLQRCREEQKQISNLHMGGSLEIKRTIRQRMGNKVEDATAPITAPDTGRLELAQVSSRTILGGTGSKASEMIRSFSATARDGRVEGR